MATTENVSFWSSTTIVENTTSTELSYYVYRTEQMAFLCILFLLIVVGNSVVLIIIFLTRKMRSRMNTFMANLAIADMMVGFFSVLVDILWKLTMQWYAGNFMCKLIKFIQGLSTFGSTYALVALSIDRLDSVARPLKSMGNDRGIKVLIGLQWMFSFLFSLPMFLFRTEYQDDEIQCIINLPTPAIWKVYFTVVTFAVFIIPAVIIAICYITIVIIIWQKSSFKMTSRYCPNEETRIVSKDSYSMNSATSTPVKYTGTKRVHWTETGSSSRGLIPKAKIKTIKMTFVIVLAFILCWSPYCIYDLIYVYVPPDKTQEQVTLTIFIQSLAPLNSAANPIIFLLFNSQIYKKLCSRGQRCNGSPTSTVLSRV